MRAELKPCTERVFLAERKKEFKCIWRSESKRNNPPVMKRKGEWPSGAD